MSFGRLVPLVMVAALGCRLANPAFEDGEHGGSDEDVIGDDSTSGNEGATSQGESSSAADTQVDGSSDQTSSDTNDGVDTNSSSDGVDTSSDGMESSSDGMESSSGSSSSDGMESSTDGIDVSTGGLDAPINNCPLLAEELTCFDCIQNNCCDDVDADCVLGQDDACHCTLQCLSMGGVNCAMNCGAGPLAAEHAQMLSDCGKQFCPLCN